MASYHIMRVISFISAPAGLPSNETTIAEMVKDVGYSTALVGKICVILKQPGGMATYGAHGSPVAIRCTFLFQAP